MPSESRACAKCQSQFPIEPDDFAFYEKIGVPPPTLCPVCRQRRRMMFRNFKTLYKRTSDKSQQAILSMYSPQSPYKVYTHEEWWSDDQDSKQYGRDFDFNRPFFEQFQELLLEVPRVNLMQSQSENCEYSNFVNNGKNCYMIFGCVDSENCTYGHIVWECKDSLDNLYLYRSELCYESIDCLGSYKLLYSQECDSCTDSIGLFDCRSCTNCIGCVGLKQKSYCIFNEQLDKAAYEAFLRDHPLNDPRTISFILAKQAELRKQLPQRHFFGLHNQGVSGNHIYNAKNVHDSFDVKGGENSRFVYTSRKAVDTYDAAFSPDIELSYEDLTCLAANRVFFCHLCWTCSDTFYSDSCFSCHNVFGCAGLKSGEYCILNKQYSKEEYESLKAKIIEHMKKTGEWGEFFPVSLSPFKHNESIAQEYFPLNKDEAVAQGFGWMEDIPTTVGQETISNDALPTKPQDFSNDLLKQVLKCDTCGRNYRFAPQEIAFYKQLDLPLPRQCFNCRHARRMGLRNVRKLWDGACAKCGTAFRTSYDPDQQKKFKVYCEQCYQTEIG